MVVLQHEHSLSLIDLNPKYPNDEEAYDDEEDLIIKQAFRYPCGCCEKEITYFHRYYYKCSQCDYSLHKLCKHIPTTLKHASHGAHSLTLILDESQGQCHMCKSTPSYKQLRYHCSRCIVTICFDCAMDEVLYHTIYHPSHHHPLIPSCGQRQILAKCDACGNEHKGVFYECSTCFRTLIHNDCVFQQKRLLIQDGTNGRFSHTHPLVLSYSFRMVDQKAKFYPTCRVCDASFSGNENIWIYKCEKCRYYAHADCANSICKPTNFKLKTELGDVLDLPLRDLTIKELNEYMRKEHNALHFPLPDLSCNIFTDLFTKESNEMSITHNFHEHPLIFVDSRSNVITKLEESCNACDTPIMDMWFYKCTYGCNFVLHDRCSRLPVELKGHLGRYTLSSNPELYYSNCVTYRQLHTLILLPKVPPGSRCDACVDRCNGCAYHCVKCDCYIDVWCALTPRFITHKSHPYHLFGKVRKRLAKDYCRICLSTFTNPDETSYSCTLCDFHMHPGCALLLPNTTRHRYDKHPMALCYRPVENHSGDYFCEVCEEEFNPNASFYHCHECVQSMHIACAPLIPQSKANVRDLHVKGLHEPLDNNFWFLYYSKEVAKTASKRIREIQNSKYIGGDEVRS